ncbi:hypothetical protein KQI86_05850 [Clostridium sp. MSJ-11]|uniref:ABC transporter permease n=1 Tax=Clostridium mobile TaxID=2841512 RepID=A0ABS6EF58_9CLOT|nr:hypothetical protein [Clostridium mobile]MBU5483848.1 hypothetical protein [Clostridium mobile]
MKALVLSELERIWSKKSTWLILLSIPLVIYASARYYLGHNLNMTIDSPQYTSFGNFANAVMQEQLIVFFNIVLILLCVLVFTDEFTSGSIRMVFIRSVYYWEVFFSKLCSVAITMFVFVMAYFILSLPIGYILMPKLENVSIFYHSSKFTIKESILYGIKYYAIAYLTLMSMAFVISFIAMISKSITSAVGMSITFLFGSLIYPQILMIAFREMSDKLMSYQLLSITHIQHMGIAMMLGEKGFFSGFILIILTVYIIVFGILSYLIFNKTSKYV